MLAYILEKKKKKTFAANAGEMWTLSLWLTG